MKTGYFIVHLELRLWSFINFPKGIKLPKTYYINALEKINYKNLKKFTVCLIIIEFKKMLKDVKYLKTSFCRK